MQKHRFRRSNSDDEVRSQKSHYTNVSKIDSIPSKNVELSLEVELDDEVRNIIKNPDQCASALLDVTVIKPNGVDQYSQKTQILKTDQVKKMIESIKLEDADKRQLMEKLFGMSELYDSVGSNVSRPATSKEKKRKSCLSSKSKHSDVYRRSLVTMDKGDVELVTEDTNSAVFSVYNQQRPIPKDLNSANQQIYTSPKTYENIRSMFECKLKKKCHRDDLKADQPCMCQNCAIVGILADSQKKPFATEPMLNPMKEERPSRHRRPSRKKSVSFKHLDEIPSTSKDHDQCKAIFKLLSTRISELEKRVIIQEEKSVPKDYFKRIITKLVNHLSKLTHYTTEERNNNLITTHRQKDISTSQNKHKSSDKYTNNRYHVNPVLIDNGYKMAAEKEYDPQPCSSSEPRDATESLWKWGEEFLTSGRDLKNKVVNMLEGTVHNLKKGWDRNHNNNLNRDDDDLQKIVEELSRNLTATVRMNSPRSKSPGTPNVNRRKNSSICISLNPKQKYERETKPRKSSLIPKFKKRHGPAVNVAYVNPQLTTWPEESSVSFKIDTSDYECHRETMTEARKKICKKEFLKVLENTKTTDKFKLWQTIWNQALENRQNKDDRVTIQIPDPKDVQRQKMIHMEYTIGDLENLLLGDRSPQSPRRL